MRKSVIIYVFVLLSGVVLFSSCSKVEDNFRAESGKVNPASIEATNFESYFPMEASSYSGIMSKGFGIDSLNVKATNGYFKVGVRGYAFRGDSTTKASYITVPMKAMAYTKKMKEFTLSLWLNIPDTTGNRKIFSIVTINGVNSIYGTLALTLDSMKLNGSLYNVTTDSTYTVSTSKTNLKINKWSHVVFTYDSTASKISLYIDGQLSNEAVCLTKKPTLTPMGKLTLSQTMSAIYMGAWVSQISGTATAKMDYFRGKIDEVRVWSKCLTADEVKALTQAERALATIQL